MTVTMLPKQAAIVPKADLWKDKMRERLVEREDLIQVMALQMFSKTHSFLLGDPGVAKTYAIKTGLNLISGLSDTDLFEILLAADTTTDEFMGFLDVVAMKQSRFSRVVDGMAPTAKFWYLDEIFKGGSAFLNTLLWALNERRYRNDGKVQDLPLHSMFCSSNELPADATLGALADRIHLWLPIKRISETGGFIRMLKGRYFPFEGPVLDMADIEDGFEESQQIIIGDAIYDALAKVQTDLRKENIEPTDRRFSQGLDIIRASAYLAGRTEADFEDIHPLQHLFWQDPQELPVVQTIMGQLANPLDERARELMETLDALNNDVDKLIANDVDEHTKHAQGCQLNGKVERAAEEVEKLLEEIKGNNKTSARVTEVKGRLKSVTGKLLTQVFDMDIDEDTL